MHLLLLLIRHVGLMLVLVLMVLRMVLVLLVLRMLLMLMGLVVLRMLLKLVILWMLLKLLMLVGLVVLWMLLRLQVWMHLMMIGIRIVLLHLPAIRTAGRLQIMWFPTLPEPELQKHVLPVVGIKLRRVRRRRRLQMIISWDLRINGNGTGGECIPGRRGLGHIFVFAHGGRFSDSHV